VLVLENGVAQEIRSARRVPAHVLLLLDTGGELNSAKRVRLTREIARKLVSALSPQDEICVMQFNNKVESLQNWTIDRNAVLHVLDTKLISGKRARFFDAVIAAATQLRDRPQGNRHVVMITDGVQSPGERVDRATAFAQLQASNAVVHVISYTSVSGKTMNHQRSIKRSRDKSLVPEDALNSIGGQEGSFGRAASQPGGVIFDLDFDRRRLLKTYQEAMRVSEKQLAQFSEDSGGRIWLPESFEEMIDDGTEAARLIDSQYVITYKPKRSLASAAEGEMRRIDVASRRVGLHLVSRRQYVVPANLPNDGRVRRIMN
jgi:VWFA-related protein